ncbi:hypothetical protein Hypma_004949 [Hypsizygus marmoreus]|uniref:Uncharacterized protein n=1 Tax=Hypsizygus marmoreus TaxID=39966 RepID=A0A369K0B6_HYPMA|nr:hypothetical protein Hypma_004949 [Hypsizygus marmoreus]
MVKSLHGSTVLPRPPVALQYIRRSFSGAREVLCFCHISSGRSYNNGNQVNGQLIHLVSNTLLCLNSPTLLTLTLFTFQCDNRCSKSIKSVRDVPNPSEAQ